MNKESLAPSSHDGLVSWLARDILDKRLHDEANGLIVGVDGKGCSGKSLLARALAAELQCHGVAVITASIDDFCNPRAIRNAPDVPEGLQVYHRNFDEQKWIKHVLKPFHSAGRLQFDEVLLDPASDLYTNRVCLNLESDGVLIAEGLHLRKRAHRYLFGYSILLHIPDDVQLARALVRDSRDRGKTEQEVRTMYKERYVPSFRHYLLEDRPCEAVDAVIDYQNPDCPILLDPQYASEIACEM
ncbi:hypothetical protein KKG90_12905 [Candidatus Bipolaricaulota bacterium]|nr:hypothetical protein [Candidatus Bipolaricaulota bacterium]